MKKFILTSMVLIICVSFKKQTTSITDYRNAYVGNYFCNQFSNGGLVSNSAQTGISNPSDTVSIIITKDILDSVLLINLGRQQIIKAKLLGKTLQAYPSNGHYGGNFYSTDSIKLIYAQSRAFSYQLKGKRSN
jgi:hypothetical protein